MGKRERKLVLLEFLAEHDLALPPSAIYRNMRLRQNITFSQRSLEKYLLELSREGLVQRIDPGPLENRVISGLDTDTSKKAYYLVADEGKRVAADPASY